MGHKSRRGSVGPQGLSWGGNWGDNWAWPEPKEHFPTWLIHEAVVGSLSSSPSGPLHRAAWVSFQHRNWLLGVIEVGLKLTVILNWLKSWKEIQNHYFHYFLEGTMIYQKETNWPRWIHNYQVAKTSQILSIWHQRLCSFLYLTLPYRIIVLSWFYYC